MEKNQLLYGDCLELMKDLPDESVDLIYLDPPFNSDVNYSMLFGSEDGEDMAQARAFADIWYWQDTICQPVYDRLLHRGGAAGRLVESLHLLLGPCGMLAYLLFMMERLIEMHRLLKKTGSLYLHCDPTASHYLKIILDGVFGGKFFQSEVIWKRSTAHSDARGMGAVHDVIFFYSKADRFKWNRVFQAYDEHYLATHYRKIDAEGRRFEDDNLTAFGLSGGGYEYEWKGVKKIWRCPIETMREHEKNGRLYYTRNNTPRYIRYLDEMPGVPIQDIWTDIPPINSRSRERLGYPTQKPLALLRRIIEASTDEGDVVLDPFCGCGTAVDAAEALNRRWIGMDVSCLAINVIRERLQNVHGVAVLDAVEVGGMPKDLAGARELVNRDPFEFERWAVGLLNGRPNDRQRGDGGADGELLLPTRKRGRAARGIISVKGTRAVNPAMVNELSGVVDKMGAALGVLVLLNRPTKGMVQTAAQCGIWEDAFSGQTWPRIQIITIEALLAGERPAMPTPLSPYTKAEYRHDDQLGMEV